MCFLLTLWLLLTLDRRMAKKAPAKDVMKETIRVTFRFHGAELEQIREVRDMLSLNSEVDAARYLMQRGLEAMTSSLTSRRVQSKMGQQVNAEQLIKQMVSMGFGPEKEL
jgi:hypothetical protein